MKDNQMKQAELLPCPFCEGEPFIVKDHLGGVIRCGNCQARMVVEPNRFGGMLDTSAWNKRAKLTTSQVSEPSKEVINTIEKLLATEMDACNNNGANSISMPDDLVGVACWLRSISVAPTTTPQEAISPAIAKWISVDDRLPNDGDYVQVYVINYGICTACFTKVQHGVNWWCRGQNQSIYPTHWMPLPSKPTGLE